VEENGDSGAFCAVNNSGSSALTFFLGISLLWSSITVVTGIIFLFAVLNIGKEDKGWPQLISEIRTIRMKMMGTLMFKKMVIIYSLFIFISGLFGCGKQSHNGFYSSRQAVPLDSFRQRHQINMLITKGTKSGRRHQRRGKVEPPDRKLQTLYTVQVDAG